MGHVNERQDAEISDELPQHTFDPVAIWENRPSIAIRSRDPQDAPVVDMDFSLVDQNG